MKERKKRYFYKEETKIVCEKCGIKFVVKKGHEFRRFCSKKCWYDWNAKNMRAFNNKRFNWKNATTEEAEQRLKQNYESKVIRKEGCWDWKGAFDKDGYGMFSSGYHRHMKAHRYSYLMHYGDLPKNMLVCHKCDNPKCTNPEHLFLGTYKINATDAKNKKRTTFGSKNPMSKLTEEQVIEIKKMLLLEIPGTKIAKKFNVSQISISNIKLNKAWKHVNLK